MDLPQVALECNFSLSSCRLKISNIFRLLGGGTPLGGTVYSKKYNYEIQRIFVDQILLSMKHLPPAHLFHSLLKIFLFFIYLWLYKELALYFIRVLNVYVLRGRLIYSYTKRVVNEWADLRPWLWLCSERWVGSEGRLRS